MPEPIVFADRYVVSVLPEDSINFSTYAIEVERKSPDRWAVLHHRFALGTDGDWDYEPLPSERTDEWKATHRFDLDTALELAKAAAPNVRVNRYTAADPTCTRSSTHSPRRQPMREEWWAIEFTDGTTEEVFGHPRTNDTGTVLTVVEEYGVTGGVKNTTHYPLANVKSWRRKNSG